MGVLAYALKKYKTEDEREALRRYTIEQDSITENDVTQRIGGVKNATKSGLVRAGYTNLRKFFEGDQWSVAKEDGSSMRTHNHCRATVNNYTAFLANETPEIDIPPRDSTDDFELARVKEVEGHVGDVLEDNGFGDEFEKAVQNGSILGDSMMIGPFWDPQEERIWFSNVKRPEHVRIIWDSENHKEILGFIIHMRLTVEKAYKRYQEYYDSIGQLPVADHATLPHTPSDGIDTHTKKYVDIVQFWDDEHMTTLVSGKTVEFENHDFGFVPLIFVPNMPHPTLEWGTSDLEDMLDPQVEYNEQISDQHDILKQIAFPTIFGSNLDVEEIEAGTSKIYDLGDEAKVFADPRNTNFPFLSNFLQTRKADITMASGLNELFTGGSDKVFQATGRALSVIMQPITNRVQGKQRRWKRALQRLVANILILTERFVEGGKELVDGHYKSDIFFSSTLVRDVTDELNKFIQKTQSQYTTMKNIGVPSPKDEQELMKKELADPRLSIEISRSPQLQLQIEQMIAQRTQQQEQGAVKERQTAAQGPTLSEGENTGEGIPSAAGVPTQTSIPAESLAALIASKNGNPPLIPNP